MCYTTIAFADVAKLADAHDSGSCGATRAGSTPVICTNSSSPNRTVFLFNDIAHCLFEILIIYVIIALIKQLNFENFIKIQKRIICTKKRKSF